MVDTAIADRPVGADATARLRDVIKQIHSSAEPLNEMPLLEPALRQTADGWRDARRLLVSPLVREGRLAPAIAALETMVAVYPARADERRLLASLFGRTEQWERA
ncbi:MAG TPA: Vi polysaccharide transport protein VexE, partial [Achromobacter sp.]